MRIAVCYDISPDRRRRKLYRVLGRWLDPVQLSVFRGDLDRLQESSLIAAIRAVIEPEDDVRVANLSRGDELCLGRAARELPGRALVVA